MLLRNGTYFHANPGKFGGASAIGESRHAFTCKGRTNNFYAGEGTVISGASIADKQAFPLGYLHPVAWHLSPKAGGIGSTLNRFVGSGTVSSANLAGGLNGESVLSGAGDISNADILWIGQLTSALSGTGTISGAFLAGGLQAVAALSGSGTISGAALSGGAAIAAALSGSGTISSASLLGTLLATATLAGTGSVSAAIAGALSGTATLSGSGALAGALLGIGTLTAPLSGSGTISSAAITGKGNITTTLAGEGDLAAGAIAKGSISADITVSGDLLTTTNVGDAVWQEVLELVSGGEPYTAQQIMQVVFAVLAGKVTGGPGSPVFKSPSDESTARVASTADVDGNRSVVTITTD